MSRLATEGKKLQIPGRFVYGKVGSRDTKIGLCEVRVVTIDRGMNLVTNSGGTPSARHITSTALPRYPLRSWRECDARVDNDRNLLLAVMYKNAAAHVPPLATAPSSPATLLLNHSLTLIISCCSIR